MADIMNYDVRTYVQELIKKEFSSKNNEEKVARTTNRALFPTRGLLDASERENRQVEKERLNDMRHQSSCR